MSLYARVDMFIELPNSTVQRDIRSMPNMFNGVGIPGKLPARSHVAVCTYRRRHQTMVLSCASAMYEACYTGSKCRAQVPRTSAASSASNCWYKCCAQELRTSSAHKCCAQVLRTSAAHKCCVLHQVQETLDPIFVCAPRYPHVA